MTTDEEYMGLADEAYSVDRLRLDPPRTKGSQFYVGSRPDEQLYEVIDSHTNAVNGFQAMAVAPVVNGHADTSQITISYAGTNPDHRADLLADVQTVVGGQQCAG